MAIQKDQQATIVISPPKFETMALRIIGESPYMQLRFSKKGEILNKMAQGSTAKGKKARECRDYEAEYKAAMYISSEGWNGIPASCFRNACISACRLVGFKMTLAKLSIFIEADGLDLTEGLPLVKLNGTPEISQMPVRNATGVMDIRTRPMWREWSCDLRIRYDTDQFTSADVVNLIARVGMQVGIGEGRPDSKSSAGLGYGMFRVGSSGEVTQ